MCVALCHLLDKQIRIVHFTQTKAKVPVKITGNEQQILWGRRIGELGKLPIGGWAHQELIEKGIWDNYFPKKVKIPVTKFMEQNVEGQCEWFDITAGFWIQGLLLKEGEEQRVYIVTFTPQKANTPYLRWPAILSHEKITY